MLRIRCPWCGVRDEVEFRYRGDATLVRPDGAAPPAAFQAFVYRRRNPRGWHLEYWLHVHGCRRLLQVVRHTLTHQIHAVVAAGEPAPWPAEPEAAAAVTPAPAQAARGSAEP